MDEDDDEYEIEKVLGSSNEIFKNEMAYFVKWKGYDETENSWVKESDAPHAGDLISKYMDEKLAKERIAAKKAAKSRKSTEPAKQEPKKRARLSTKSKAYSDEEEPERSPVRPIAKKQKKAPAPTKKKVEPGHDEEDPEMVEFAPMDRYMDLDSWEALIDTVDTIERDGGDLIIYGTLTTKEHFRLPSSTCNDKFPKKIIKFYEDNLRWKASDEGA